MPPQAWHWVAMHIFVMSPLPQTEACQVCQACCMTATMMECYIIVRCTRITCQLLTSPKLPPCFLCVSWCPNPLFLTCRPTSSIHRVVHRLPVLFLLCEAGNVCQLCDKCCVAMPVYNAVLLPTYGRAMRCCHCLLRMLTGDHVVNYSEAYPQ